MITSSGRRNRSHVRQRSFACACGLSCMTVALALAQRPVCCQSLSHRRTSFFMMAAMNDRRECYCTATVQRLPTWSLGTNINANCFAEIYSRQLHQNSCLLNLLQLKISTFLKLKNSQGLLLLVLHSIFSSCTGVLIVMIQRGQLANCIRIWFCQRHRRLSIRVRVLILITEEFTNFELHMLV